MRNIPEEFYSMLRPVAGDFDAFRTAMERGEPRRGLRANTLRITAAAFAAIAPFRLTPSPLCPDAFLIEPDAPAGVHPYHAAGLYYLQEPSASAVGAALRLPPGARVLDLCAAPGGKATHIAAQLGGEGVLAANEYVASRIQPLRSNLERCGVRNAVIWNAAPERLARDYAGFFDAVVVDAPCSGEGMFRREAAAIAAWSPEHVQGCAVRQQGILDAAARMVRPGGQLIYSACTLNRQEDEAVAEYLLKRRPEYALQEVRRLMPHEVPGEGHFLARFSRTDGETAAPEIKNSPFRPLEKAERAVFDAFWMESFTEEPWCEPAIRGDTVWLCPEAARLPGLTAGVPAGQIRGKRFEPAHALYLAADPASFVDPIVLLPEEETLARFMRGEEIPAVSAGANGYRALCVGTGGDTYYALGFGKRSNGVLKNHYPKGLRLIGR